MNRKSGLVLLVLLLAAGTGYFLFFTGARAPEAKVGTDQAGKAPGPSPHHLPGKTLEPGASRPPEKDVSPPKRKKIAPPTRSVAKNSSPKEILVQVKDHAGNPLAGVPVAIGEWKSFEMGKQDSSFFLLEEKKTTMGPEGIARFVLKKKRGISFPPRKTPEALALVVLAPLSPPLRKSFGPGEIPNGPVVFTLPPTGSLEVRVREPKGLVSHGAIVKVFPISNAGKGFWVLRSLGQLPPGSGSAPVEKGIARVPFVGLGLELAVKAQKTETPTTIGEYPTVTVKGAGPTAPGETASIDVFLPDKETLLSGRLLYPSKRPVSRKKVKFHQYDKNPLRSFYWQSFLTDESGRFQVIVADWTSLKTPVLQFKLEKGRDQGSYQAIWKPKADLIPGRMEIGDITLLPPTVLVEGKVVDEEGVPVPSASVRVLVKVQFGEREKITIWAPHPDKQTWTKKDGKFLIFGKTDLSSIKVQVTKMNWRKKVVPLRPGTKNLTIVLEKKSGPEGLDVDLVPDPRIPLKDLEVFLTRKDPNSPVLHSFFASIRGKTARFIDMDPGNYTLTVRLRRDFHPLVEIPNLLVGPGGTCRDPRLKRVDLRGKAAVVEVVDASGKGVLTALLSQAEFPYRKVGLKKGNKFFLPPSEGASFRIKAWGYKSKEIHLVGSYMKVVLEKALQLHLVYDGDLPSPPFYLGVSLKKKIDPRSMLEAYRKGKKISWEKEEPPTAWFKNGKTLETFVSEPGKYELTWMLQKNEIQGAPSEGLYPEKETILEVKDLPGPQEIHLSYPGKIQGWR